MKTWQRWQDAQAMLQKKREAEARLLWANKPDKLQQAKDEITEVSILRQPCQGILWLLNEPWSHPTQMLGTPQQAEKMIEIKGPCLLCKPQSDCRPALRPGCSLSPLHPDLPNQSRGRGSWYGCLGDVKMVPW